MTNKLYYGDNLQVLRDSIASESVDLIYIDPPFNSKANYNVLFRSPDGQSSHAQMEAFDDTWHWTDESEKAFDEVMHSGNSNAAEMLRAMRSFLKENDMMAYLAMMAVRLLELHRVLKQTGSLYVHCDPTASHYLKILLDSIFLPTRFINEIAWRRTTSHTSAKKYAAVHDVIFYYRKSDDSTWNEQRIPHENEYLDKYYKYDDGDGRLYWRDNLTGAGVTNGSSGQPWRGNNPGQIRRHWAVPNDIIDNLVGSTTASSLTTQQKLDILDENNLIHWPVKGSGMPTYKRYRDQLRGLAVPDVWDNIHSLGGLGGKSSERLGYQTQKPVALLERIISASSNPGDVVLDAFCGCGTTIHAAQKLGRQWIGIDVTHLAISLIEKRLNDAFPGIQYEVHGTPRDVEGAQALADADKYQFQWWAVSLVKAVPFGGKKKGADTGIDGVIYFKPDGKTTEKAIVSVKGGEHVNVAMIRDLGHVIDREKAKVGVFITLAPPTRPMEVEAVRAGFYQTPGHGNVPKIQILTIEQLFAGKKPDIPMVDEGSFKKAKREQVTAQHDLF